MVGNGIKATIVIFVEIQLVKTAYMSRLRKTRAFHVAADDCYRQHLGPTTFAASTAVHRKMAR